MRLHVVLPPAGSANRCTTRGLRKVLPPGLAVCLDSPMENVETKFQFNESTPFPDGFKEAVSERLMDVLMEYNMTGHTVTVDIHPND